MDPFVFDSAATLSRLTESTRDSVRVVMFLLLLFDLGDEGNIYFGSSLIRGSVWFCCGSTAENCDHRALGGGGRAVMLLLLLWFVVVIWILVLGDPLGPFGLAAVHRHHRGLGGGRCSVVIFLLLFYFICL